MLLFFQLQNFCKKSYRVSLGFGDNVSFSRGFNFKTPARGFNFKTFWHDFGGHLIWIFLILPVDLEATFKGKKVFSHGSRSIPHIVDHEGLIMSNPLRYLTCMVEMIVKPLR